jgi:hypothetical protein
METQSMAYLARIDVDNAHPLAHGGAPTSVAPVTDFTPLEWSVIRLARIDRLWTIGKAGTLRRAWNALLGRGNPALASERLEALRRMAVLSWHYGFTVPGGDVAEFLAAGFTSDQYEKLVSSIRKSVHADVIRTATEAFA